MFHILRLFFRPIAPVPLGRWGYHWDLKRKYQTYYD